MQSSRESVLLRGASAAEAVLHVEPQAPAPRPRTSPEVLSQVFRPARSAGPVQEPAPEVLEGPLRAGLVRKAGANDLENEPR